MRTEGYFGRKVETVASHLLDGLGQLQLGPSGGVHRLPPEVAPVGGQQVLLRYPVDRREHGAQALVAAHDVRQSNPQSFGVEWSGQPQCAGAVVNR
jgi:hypothetical protein